MSKAVLISIHPEWCGAIANGRKTIEVRNTRPKIDTPFKCYIYCTKAGDRFLVHSEKANGKVVGEFVCDWIEKYGEDTEYGKYYMTEDECRDACLSNGDIGYYAQGKDIYGWHIFNLVIYDKPRELSEFYSKAPCQYWHGNMSSILDQCFYEYPCENICNQDICRGKRMSRPPQSWCYVEEL